jgi:predicted class III extradiol MEMO1 family dioxygenase
MQQRHDFGGGAQRTKGLHPPSRITIGHILRTENAAGGIRNVQIRRAYNMQVVRGGLYGGSNERSDTAFGKRVEKNALDMVREPIPRKTFGVYVTIHRRIDGVWLLHGCMGWSLQENEVTPTVNDEDVRRHIRDVANAAAVRDSRRKTGGDRYKIKVTFMLRDLYPIDNTNGQHDDPDGVKKDFQNDNEWGCVVVSQTGGFITYLPGVFPHMQWNDFARSLAEKAGYAHYMDQRFYAYRVAAIEKEFVFYPLLLLIPHAGKEYAGKCRADAFKKVPQPVENIYYLSADHGNTNGDDHDHSYLWVKKELEEWFPGAVHTVKKMNSWQSAVDAAENCPEDALVIGTTDLGHYGPKYSYEPWRRDSANVHPWDKEQHEEAFTNAILEVRPDVVQKMVEKNSHLACGPYSLYALLLIASSRNMLGHKQCYIDSRDNSINVFPKDNKNFVSYVSATFS